MQAISGSWFAMEAEYLRNFQNLFV